LNRRGNVALPDSLTNIGSTANLACNTFVAPGCDHKLLIVNSLERDRRVSSVEPKFIHASGLGVAALNANTLVSSRAPNL